MLIAVLLLGLLQGQLPPAQSSPRVYEPSAPALAAKAPGAPGYGLQTTIRSGKILLTTLRFHLVTRKVQAQLYRVRGPAGMGPYRLGVQLQFHPQQQAPNDVLHPIWYANYFAITSAQDGFPAKAAGLEGRWVIERIDGSNFGWDLGALIFHISNSPVINVDAAKLPMFGGPSRKTFRITMRKVDGPVDPGDGTLEPIQANSEIQEWLNGRETWRDLLILRSRQARFAPLPIDLAGHRIWVVRNLGQPSPDSSRMLEFWREDPLTGAWDTGLVDLWPEPPDGLRPGRAIRSEDHWYRILASGQDPVTGRLDRLDLRPWEPDIDSLLGGATLAKDLGRLNAPPLQESIEQLANESLVEWKTRTLPGLLAAQNLGPAEDLVIRIEKGVLALDLETKGIRARLDAAARAEAERKAQAELAAKTGQPATQAQATPATESERLADLLEQRKAILMAILGSAKQSLVQLRR